MVRLEDITTECLDRASMQIEAGVIYKIITKSDHTKRVLLDTMLGIRKPLEGRVLLFGEDIWKISNRAVLNILKHMGVVWAYGGLISNLKVWENLAMPLAYHGGVSSEDLEEKIIAIYKQLGRDVVFSEYMSKLPGPLPINEKKLIALVREMLMEPKVIIYDALFEGFAPEMVSSLAIITAGFHSKSRNRATLYVSSDQDSFMGIKEDVLIREDNRGLVVWG